MPAIIYVMAGATNATLFTYIPGENVLFSVNKPTRTNIEAPICTMEVSYEETMYTLEDDYDASSFKRKQAERKEEGATQPPPSNEQEVTEDADISDMPTNVTVTDTTHSQAPEEQDPPATVREQISQSLHQ